MSPGLPFVHSRYYITPPAHALLSAVRAATRAQAVFACDLAAPRLAFLRDCVLQAPTTQRPAAAAVLPMAALLEIAVGAVHTFGGDDGAPMSLSRATAEQLQPLSDASVVTVTLSHIAGTSAINGESISVPLLAAAVSRVGAWQEPADGALPDIRPRKVAVLERIARSAPALAQAQEAGRPLAAVQPPLPGGGDGFLQHPAVLSAALTLTDVCEDAAATDGPAMAVEGYLLSQAALDTWAAAEGASSATATAGLATSVVEVRSRAAVSSRGGAGLLSVPVRHDCSSFSSSARKVISHFRSASSATVCSLDGASGSGAHDLWRGAGRRRGCMGGGYTRWPCPCSGPSPTRRGWCTSSSGRPPTTCRVPPHPSP